MGIRIDRVRYAIRSSPAAAFLAVATCVIAGLLVVDAAWQSTSGSRAAGSVLGMVAGIAILGRRPAGNASPLLPASSLYTNAVVELRLPSRRDVDGLLRSIDREVTETNGWTHAQARAVRALARLPRLAGEAGWRVAVERSDGELVGVVQFTAIDTEGTSAQVGLWLGPWARGRRLGSACLEASASLAWAGGLHRLRIGTASDNTAMLRACERAGATVVETRPHTLPNGSTTPSTWFELRPAGDLPPPS